MRIVLRIWCTSFLSPYLLLHESYPTDRFHKWRLVARGYLRQHVTELRSHVTQLRCAVTLTGPDASELLDRGELRAEINDAYFE